MAVFYHITTILKLIENKHATTSFKQVIVSETRT